MSRYVDIEKIEYVPCTICQYNGKEVVEMIAYKKLIDIMPVADVEEVRHGEWIPLGCSDDDWNLLRFKCSICGREIHEHKNYDQLLKIKYPYCHCGAHMR